MNGSVGEWASSRVGAQVTYSCDTHLVLVGETVATCSLPSLTWLPSSGDVTCVQPIAMSGMQGSFVNSQISLFLLLSVECENPSQLLQANVYFTSLNSSMIGLYCDDGYSLDGSETSECFLGQWTPSLQLAMCLITDNTLSSQL